MLEELDLHFRNAVAVKVLGQYLGFGVKRGKNGMKTYVDGTIMYLARLDAWAACVATPMDAEEGRKRQRQMSFSTLYAKYLPQAVDGILKTASEAVKAVHAIKFENDSVHGGE